MPYDVKDWINELSPLGPPADVDVNTPISAQALEDLEQRLSDYTASSPLKLQEVYGATGSETVGGAVNSTSAIQDAIDSEGVAVGGDFWYGIAPGTGLDLSNARYVDLKLVRMGTYAYGDNDSRIVTNADPTDGLTGRITIEGRGDEVQRADDTTGNVTSSSATIASVADTSTYLAAVGMFVQARKASDGSKITWNRTGAGGGATDNSAKLLSKTSSTLVLDGTANASSTGATISFDQSENLRSTACTFNDCQNLGLVLTILNYPGGGFHIQDSEDMVISLITRDVQRGACVPKGNCSGSLYLDLIGPDGADDLVNLAVSDPDYCHDFTLMGRAHQGQWLPGGGNECVKITGAKNVGIWMELSGGQTGSLFIHDGGDPYDDTTISPTIKPRNIWGNVVVTNSGNGVVDPNVAGHGIVVSSQGGYGINIDYAISNPGGNGVLVEATGGGTVRANLNGSILNAGSVDTTREGVRYRDADGGGVVRGKLSGSMTSPAAGAVGMAGTPDGHLTFDIEVFEPDPLNDGNISAVTVDGPDVGIKGLRVRKTDNDYKYALKVDSGNVYVENIDALEADCLAIVNGAIITPQKALPVRFGNGDNVRNLVGKPTSPAAIASHIDLRHGTDADPATGTVSNTGVNEVSDFGPLLKLNAVTDYRRGSPTPSGTEYNLASLFSVTAKGASTTEVLINCGSFEAWGNGNSSLSSNSDDVQGVEFRAEVADPGTGQAIAGVFYGTDSSTASGTGAHAHGAKCIELNAQNQTGTEDDAYVGGPNPKHMGMTVEAGNLSSGNKLAGGGIVFGADSATEAQFGDGICFGFNNPIRYATIADYGESENCIVVGGQKSGGVFVASQDAPVGAPSDTIAAPDHAVLANDDGTADRAFALYGDGTLVTTGPAGGDLVTLWPDPDNQTWHSNGAFEADAGGFKVTGASAAIGTLASAYTASNVTTDRTYDANATSIDELADVLGTLITDLKSMKVIA